LHLTIVFQHFSHHKDLTEVNEKIKYKTPKGEAGPAPHVAARTGPEDWEKRGEGPTGPMTNTLATNSLHITGIIRGFEHVILKASIHLVM